VKRPSFQFYPGDWRANANLRRCSPAARGAWVDVLCVLHDSDEYGVCRWPLIDLANASGVPLKLAQELVSKDVLKGADKAAKPYIYTPRHAGKDGDPVTLVEPKDGPCWYSSRFVRDEYVRLRRGSNTQFTDTNQPPKAKPKVAIGERQGDGSSSASSSSSSSSNKTPKGAPAGFDEFWSAYPRKDAKPRALKAFAKVTEPLVNLLSAITRQRASELWSKEGGKYIPMPATWLNDERWNDGVNVATATDDAETKAAIEKQAFEKGLQAWDGLTEQWPVYKARVLRAPRIQGFNLLQLGEMAAKHQKAHA
jgi:hypothetical protein